MRISDWSSDVCSSDLDIPEIGDYFKVDLGRESFIVVRNGPGDHDIAAYYNVCPHRGNRIAHGDSGSVGSDGCFRCDFHGWRFGIDGSTVEIRDEIIFRPEAIAHRPARKPIPCDGWNSPVFISLTPAESGRGHVGNQATHAQLV